MMLTVQMRIGSVETDRRKGRSHSRYHGYTTGANKSDAAIGQANASDGRSADFVLNQIAVTKPASAANATANCGENTRSTIANTGSLKRKLCTYVPSDPMGTRPFCRKGK